MNSDSSTRRARRRANASFRGLAISAIFSLALALLGANNALAADLACGVDTDLNGSVDNLCPGIDQDNDGYTSDGSIGWVGVAEKDCDDTNHYINPSPGGKYFKGSCSAGEFKTCNADGTTSACAALSTLDCSSGGGDTYWIDDDETNCAGTGGYNDEWNWMCTSNTGLSGYHSPVAGDCYVHRGGVYSGGSFTASSSKRHIYLSNKDGTSTDRITFIAAPGETWWEAGAGNGVVIDGDGTVGDSIHLMQFADSDYIDVIGFEGKTGASGYNTVGIHFANSSGSRAFNNYIPDLHGECGGDNCSGISMRVGPATGNIARYNHIGNVNEVGDELNENTAGITNMDIKNFYIQGNVLISSEKYGFGIKGKHGAHDNTFGYVTHNIIGEYTNRQGIGMNGFVNLVVSNNYIYKPGNAGIFIGDLGSSTDKFDNINVEYNTIVDAAKACYILEPENTHYTFGSTAVRYRYNICTSAKVGTWPISGDGGYDFGVWNAGFDTAYSGSDASDYAQVIGAGVISIDNNCFYKASGAALLASVFGNDNLVGRTDDGDMYTSFSAWQAAGWDVNGYNENPSLDSYGRATSTNCSNKGWLLATSSSTLTGNGRNARIKRGRLLK